MARSRSRSPGEASTKIPVRIILTRTARRAVEIPNGLDRQISSTSGKSDLLLISSGVRELADPTTLSRFTGVTIQTILTDPSAPYMSKVASAAASEEKG